MYKKNAFTLAEVLVCLMIIGFLAVIMMKNLVDSSGRFDTKARVSNAFKALEAIEEATIKITELETTSCPTGLMLTNITGSPTYTFFNSSGNSTANAAEVANIYSNYLKFENTGLNFCNYTNYCNNSAFKGGKLHGNIYVGFQVYSNVANCPGYYLPNATSNSASRGDKCWGNVYIDVDPKGTDTLGDDVFVFGMNGKGVSR